MSEPLPDRDSPDKDSVEALLDACLDQEESRWAEAVAAVGAAHPDLAEELRRRFEILQRIGMVGAEDSTAGADTKLEDVLTVYMASGEWESGLDRLLDSRPEIADRVRQTLDRLTLDGEGLHVEEETEGERPDIPGFEILKVLGQGGMGTVYLAEQLEPVRRHVALKVIKLGMDSRQVLQRFELERQALAMMNHDSIARVFDAGATSRGLPYFVMEYVPGIPLTDHCDVNKLSTRERLALFQVVCAGVQHAHQKGIIHRDLKPTNILVSTGQGKPVPKIIDFGLARATEEVHPVGTQFTEHGQILGTPAYMSPEQAGMSAPELDTRTDIYSLGVVLYELLTGHLPFSEEEFQHGGFLEMQRMIIEVDPPKPSSRLATRGERTSNSARLRQTTLSALSRDLRGDLDWVVMKAIEKDRSRRYGTANELAGDVERFLNHEPVTAAAPSAIYRLRKIVRKHRVPVIAGAVVFLTAIAGAIVSLNYASTAETERNNAEDRRQTAEHTLAAMEEMLEGLRPEIARGRDTTLLKSLLDGTAERVDTAYRDQPESEIRMRTVLGRSYFAIGELEASERHLLAAERLSEDLFGAEDRRTLLVHGYVAQLMLDQEKAVEAEAKLRATVQTQLRVIGPDDEDTLFIQRLIGHALSRQGRHVEAIEILRGVLERHLRVFGRDAGALSTMNTLAIELHNIGESEEAEALHKETIEAGVHDPDHPSLVLFRGNRAIVLKALGRFEDAKEEAVEVVAKMKVLFGPEHPQTLRSMHNLASCLRGVSEFEASETLFLEVREIRVRLLGPDHRMTLTTSHDLAQLLMSRGRYSEAEKFARETVDGFRRTIETSHESFLLAIQTLGLILNSLREFEESAKFLGERVALMRAAGGKHPDMIMSLYNWAAVLQTQNRNREAIPVLREVLARRPKGNKHPFFAAAMTALGKALYVIEDFVTAEKHLRDAVALRREVLPKKHPHLGDSLDALGGALIAQDKDSEAETLLRECLEIRKVKRPDSPTLAETHGKLGEALTALSKFEEAEKHLLRSARVLDRKQSFERLVELYTAWGKPAELEKWKARLE